MTGPPPGDDGKRGSFAPPPPPSAPSPFAPPPPVDAYARTEGVFKAGERGLASKSIVGDGGPPSDLPLVVGALMIAHLMDAVLLYRMPGPMSGCWSIYGVFVIAALFAFWSGRNWARVLVLALSTLELVLIVLILGVAMSVARARHLATMPEIVGALLTAAFDVWLIRFCVRPDTVAFFDVRARSSYQRR